MDGTNECLMSKPFSRFQPACLHSDLSTEPDLPDFYRSKSTATK